MTTFLLEWLEVCLYRGVGGENMNENMSDEFSEQSCAVLKMMEPEGLWVQFPDSTTYLEDTLQSV